MDRANNSFRSFVHANKAEIAKGGREITRDQYGNLALVHRPGIWAKVPRKSCVHKTLTSRQETSL